jgi:hypothetical protein
VTRIDTPQLEKMRITFLSQINFDTPRLAQFINCTPTLRAARDKAHVGFDRWGTSVALLARSRTLEISIFRVKPDRQLSSVAQVCNSLPPSSTVEDLYIERRPTELGHSQVVWKNDAIENTQWLRLLLPFTAVKNLYLSKEFAPGIAAALQKLVGVRIAEVLPSAEYFCGGARAVGPFPGKDWAVRCRATAFRSHITSSAWNRDSESIPVRGVRGP